MLQNRENEQFFEAVEQGLLEIEKIQHVSLSSGGSLLGQTEKNRSRNRRLADRFMN